MAVRVPIVADYDPSGVKSAQAAFANFGQSVSKSLQQASRDARKNLGALSEGLDGAGSAADRLIASIGQTADRLDSELKQSRAAADALARSLGPDFAARVGQGGIERLVIDLRKAGLTLEEITADADRLGAALGQLDDVNLSNVRTELGTLDDGMKRVGDSADRSRGVLANFTGNAAQEIPGVSAAMGPLNTAIGQFAEYAAEGGISLSGLAKTVGPIAGIAAGIGILKGVLGASSERAKLLAKDAEIVTDALLEQKDAVDALAQAGIRAKKLDFFDPDSGIFGGAEDIIPRLDQLGYQWADIEKVLRGGAPAAKEFANQLRAIAESQVQAEKATRGGNYTYDDQLRTLNQYDDILAFINQKIKGIAEGTNDAALQTRFWGGELEDTKPALEGAIPGADGLGIALGFVNESGRLAAGALQLLNAEAEKAAKWNLRNLTLGLERGIRFGFAGGDPSASGVEFGTGAPGSTRTLRATATANAQTRAAIVNNYTVTVNGPIDAEQTAAAIRRVLNQSAQRNGIPQDYN